jgi:hypothetical protein
MSKRTFTTLSVRHPWAWLLVNGPKDGENRSWPTKVRGLVAIHAGKTVDHKDITDLREKCRIHLPATFDTGKIVGFVNIVGCVRDHDSGWFFPPNFFFVTNARVAWDGPAVKGRLGFFQTEIAGDVRLSPAVKKFIRRYSD